MVQFWGVPFFLKRKGAPFLQESGKKNADFPVLPLENRRKM